MSKKAWLLICVAAFLFFVVALVVKMPADFAVAHLLKNNREVTVAQISGTLLHGEAGYVSVKKFGKSIELGDVKWQLHPAALLLGQVQLQLKAVNGEQKIAGDFTLKMDKTLHAENAELRVDAALITRLYPVLFKPEGQIELDVRDFTFRDMQVLALDANLVARNLSLTVQDTVELGTYGARLSLVDEAIKADVSDIDGQVSIEGSASFTPKTRQYAVDMQLKPKPGAHAAIAQSLAFVGKQQGDGSFVVKMQRKM